MRGITCAVVAATVVLGTAPTGVAAPAEAPIVETADGPVEGRIDGTLRRFEGIPYAAPPVGPRRRRPPEPVRPWTDPRDATKPGPACVQPSGDPLRAPASTRTASR